MTDHAAQKGGQLSPGARRSIWGAFLGLFVDSYDIYVPIIALAPALAYFEPKDLPVMVATTLFYVVFAVTLVGRPIGAFIFGHFADRLGRKRTTMISVGGFGVMTLLMALLPGYRSWGLGALIALLILRLLDGVFLGGEYTAATPLAIEMCPKPLRGFYGSVIQGGYPIAYVAISVLTSAVLHIAPANGAGEAYLTWGWRIPFFVGALLALVFLIYYRSVPESHVWEKAEKSASPLKQLFQGSDGRAFWQVFVLMSGFWFAFEGVAGTLPGLLIKVLKLPSLTVTNGMLVANIALLGGYILAGIISQAVGRRLTLIWAGIGIAILDTFLYIALVNNAQANGSVLLTLTLAAVLTIITVAPFGIMPSYLNERFQTAVRSSGYGIGYSLAIVIPSFYAFIMLGLSKIMPYAYAQIPLVILGGLLMLIGAAVGPETAHVDLETLEGEIAVSPAGSFAKATTR